METTAEHGIEAANSTRWQRWHRQLAVLFLGFASGLPLALTGQAMQAWLTMDGIDIATIGFFGLVGIPYTFKFLWAPLMDRFEPPLLGRRRGWLVTTQLALAAILFLMATLTPKADTALFAWVAVLVAFLSASQDVVIDAYRSDILPAAERGLGASLTVTGYRIGMILSGGVALIWADQWQSWGRVYQIMAMFMAVAAVISLFFIPKVSSEVKPLNSKIASEWRGFFAMLVAVVIGIYVAKYALILLGLNPEDKNKWIQLLFVLMQIVVALPFALWAARKAGFETLNHSLESYFSQAGAWSFLILIVLYKLGDAFAGSLTTPFLLKGMMFTQAEIGLVNKIIGIWLTILGGIAGGFLMLRLGLLRSLLVFGVLQILSNFGFYLLSIMHKGAWGGVFIHPFDWGFIALKEGATLDYLLMSAVAVENISGGMGTAALVALLMALCNKRFSATQFALLSALTAVGRIYVSPVSGVLSESIGWSAFFLFSVLVGLPGMLMVWYKRKEIDDLDRKPNN